jgi:putative transposase
MKQVNLSYFKYYQRLYGYYGHFWQDRYKSNLIDTDSYLLQCGKYIELNPVRAKIVRWPEEYRFSSYQFYANGVKNNLIQPNPVYLNLAHDLDKRKKLYEEFVIDENVINSNKINKSHFIGNSEFISKSIKIFGVENSARKRGRPRKNRTVPI